MSSKKELRERESISKENQWDLEAMYESVEKWNESYKMGKKLATEFEKHKGKVASSSKELLDTLKDQDELYRIVGNLYSYAHMKLDEDTRKSSSQELSDKGLGLYVEIEDKTSFVTPEILTLDEETIKEYFVEEPKLQLYRKYIGNIIRQREHVLSPREESILAQMGELANAPEKIFSMLNNADIKFPKIKDENGEEVELTHGNYIPFMESDDRQVRRDAYEALYDTYSSFKNTFAASLDGELKKNIFNSNIRNYSSSREASLDQNNISLSVYDNLIESVHENLDTMYKYMEIRKRALGVEELHMYDIYTPIVKDVDMKIPFDEGVEKIKKALAPLGSEYMDVVEEGFSSRWIDIYENKGKRSGAYSGGSYDSKPFILLNYHDTLDNMFTTAHELGHSIHSYFTRKNQPFIYGNYSIFVAEVASTANEALLMDYMLKNTEDKNEKLYLLNHYLESFRGTVFRQTMFAEFEMKINKHLESGGALTADYLSETYKELNKLYYGPDVVVDDKIAIEWARIPHFYYNFYVFQYATGYSAAVALSQAILKEGTTAVNRYLNFLKSGSSDYPINVLETAGVDMTTKKPVDDAMKLFKQLVDEMDKLI